jgi:hypothetical protein
MKKYMLILVPILLFVLINSSQGEESFTLSVDVRELLSNLKFKIDPGRHSIVIFGIQWKVESQKEDYPLTALIRGIRVDKHSLYSIYYEGKEDDYSLFGEEGLWKLAEGDSSALYMFVANTVALNSSIYDKGKDFTILSGASSEVIVSGFVLGQTQLTIKRKEGNKYFPLIFSYPIRKGSIYYIGIFPLEDITLSESPLKLPVKSDKSLANIKNIFPKVDGFKFIDQ